MLQHPTRRSTHENNNNQTEAMGMYLEHLRDPDLNLIEISEYIQQ
ncbi:hypothetical protein [Pseudomonas sp. DR48]|nr:hypothetical protein [Pseudomonas sp. DR48]